MSNPGHLVKNQMLYYCHALDVGILLIALQRIISVRLIQGANSLAFMPAFIEAGSAEQNDLYFFDDLFLTQGIALV